MNRRHALKQSIHFGVGLWLTQSWARAATTPPQPAVSHYLFIGDWGWTDNGPQTRVAAAMANYVKHLGIRTEAMFLLGDNFYGPFHGGTDSERWKSQFEDMYPKEVFAGPCYAVPGNHDYSDQPGTALAAELAYAKTHSGTRWNMPAKWYRLEIGPKNAPLATVLALDSNYHSNKNSLTEAEQSQQLAWLTAELEKPRTSPWLIAMAHHPLYSNGAHGDTKALIRDWDPLFRKHQVDFYFCGHDHDLQHLEIDHHPTSFVISGGGGAELRETSQKRGPFAKSSYGFTHLEVTPKQCIARHIDASGQILHGFVKKSDHSWAPL